MTDKLSERMRDNPLPIPDWGWVGIFRGLIGRTVGWHEDGVGLLSEIVGDMQEALALYEKQGAISPQTREEGRYG